MLPSCTGKWLPCLLDLARAGTWESGVGGGEREKERSKGSAEGGWPFGQVSLGMGVETGSGCETGF